MKKLHLKVNDKISLKIPELEDANAVFLLIDSNRKHLEKYMEWESKTNLVEDVISFFNSNKYHSYYDKSFPLIIRYENQIVGIIDFNSGNSIKKSVNIGYWVSKDFSGKGIVTKSCQALINFAFAITDIESIYINCEITNTKSQAIPLKLGFEFMEQTKAGCYIKDGNAEMISYLLKKPVLV